MRVDFGGGQEIYYTRRATQADARALGQVRQAGFFDGRSSAVVQVAREGDRMIVSFILQLWAVNDVRIQGEFSAMGDQASAKAFAGRRVEVRLCDEYSNTKKKML
jgi:hypothetical protein